MAEKRMFAKAIIDSDLFLEMPQTSQNLYFHLAMRADDDGFVNNPKSIIRLTGCREDDIKLLIAKDFVIPFESGVVVIKHWRIHNYIRRDTYHETTFQDEKKALTVSESGEYQVGCNNHVTEPSRTRNEAVTKSSRRLDKIRLDKIRLGEGEESPTPSPSKAEAKHKHGEYEKVKLTDKELQKLIADYGEANITEYIRRLDEYIAMKGDKYKSHNATLRNWLNRDGVKKTSEQQSSPWSEGMI